MSYKNPLNILALVLVIVGALNWGLVGAFDYNLVNELFGVESLLANITYIAVGIAGLYLIAISFAVGAKEVDRQAV